MKRYYSLNEYYKQKYGKKVYKLAINGGMTCPNRDGTLGERGCIFCGAGGSGEFASSADMPVVRQLETAIQRVSAKNPDGAYIAYFQPFTNTYADVSYLRQIFFEAISPEYIVGLSIATRPDCLPPEVLDLLFELNRIKPVTVELGLQTIHDSTAQYIRRGYPLSVYDEAVSALHERGIEVVTHLILGLPGETGDMIAESARYAGAVSDGVKLQLLHVLESTDLAEEYKRGEFEALSLEEYTRILCRCLTLLPKNIVVHRLTGDGAKRLLIAPLWSADKKRVLNYINTYIEENDVRQGSAL